jgi:hypothetical protein
VCACIVCAAACARGKALPAGPDTSAVTVSATGSSTTPSYTWSGPLAVSVNVARVAVPSAAVWGISSPVNRDIASGARHGVVPPGATETATAERVLTVGVRYRVTVALTDGTAGSVDFTP